MNVRLAYGVRAHHSSHLSLSLSIKVVTESVTFWLADAPRACRCWALKASFCCGKWSAPRDRSVTKTQHV
jgi:hypothetical protein